MVLYVPGALRDKDRENKSLLQQKERKLMNFTPKEVEKTVKKADLQRVAKYSGLSFSAILKIALGIETPTIRTATAVIAAIEVTFKMKLSLEQFYFPEETGNICPIFWPCLDLKEKYEL